MTLAAEKPVASKWQIWRVANQDYRSSMRGHPDSRKQGGRHEGHSFDYRSRGVRIRQPAQAGVNDPEVIIYRFPGLMDSGGSSNAGVATSIHCTNFSGVMENLRVAVRSKAGTLVANAVSTIPHLFTLTISTHDTLFYNELSLETGVLNQGTAAVAATSINIVCTAVTLDASSAVPNGFALRGIRFSPVPGSQE